MNATSAIEATGLRKHFGKTVALDGLNLTVPTGTVHGSLGPNGSGKSTTIRILLGLITSNGGRASVLGGSQDRARIKTMTERFDLDPTKKARSYSKGNRQKVALVAALASRAELFIFDEPTSGLDPLMEQVFQQCVDEIDLETRFLAHYGAATTRELEEDAGADGRRTRRSHRSESRGS